MSTVDRHALPHARLGPLTTLGHPESWSNYLLARLVHVDHDVGRPQGEQLRGPEVGVQGDLGG
eukprot:5756681-Pyramimonas_sp.AAC.1